MCTGKNLLSVLNPDGTKRKKSTIINSYKFTFSRKFSMHTQDRFCIMLPVYNPFQCIKNKTSLK